MDDFAANAELVVQSQADIAVSRRGARSRTTSPRHGRTVEGASYETDRDRCPHGPQARASDTRSMRSRFASSLVVIVKRMFSLKPSRRVERHDANGRSAFTPPMRRFSCSSRSDATRSYRSTTPAASADPYMASSCVAAHDDFSRDWRAFLHRKR